MKYAAFFRGLNVGGKNRVNMANLTQLFYDLGLSDVKTYIQSGNVIFTSDKNIDILTVVIENAFESSFGFKSYVILRTSDEIAQIVSAKPFSEAEIEKAQYDNPQTEHVYIFMSGTGIPVKLIDKLNKSESKADKFYADKKEIYLFCYDSIRNSKYASILLKKEVMLTSRNQKTMNKINELIKHI